jgi:UDP-2,4-diacetamido-2,4,6-trideoxy-beta-L-altropyranose hydrolase
MASADLSIGGGGTMIWERCYLGLPTILICIADNQVNQAKSVHSYGAVIYLGIFKEGILTQIVEQLNNLYSNPNLNISISKKALELMNIPDYISHNGPTDFVVDALLKI